VTTVAVKDTESATVVGIQDLVEAVQNHALYAQVCDERSLRLLMRSHVFAVWDFQSLLKALQRMVTCLDVPWLPTASPEARRFVNEIVLDEESDECPGGGYLSHFELYRKGMGECGADTRPIDEFIGALMSGRTVDEALEASRVSPVVKRFVRTTLGIATSGQPHLVAAAFSYGREDIIPRMFQHLVESLMKVEPSRWATFHHYLVRHIESDGSRHGPMARNLVARLCESDPRLRAEAQATARTCLAARIALWDQILTDIRGEARARA
jgi:hypothetical protein